jgi:hypothetical protein
MALQDQERFLKGAFVEVPTGKGSEPMSPIYFQFNPETLERTKSGTWTSAQSQRQKADDAASKKEFDALKGKKVKAGFVPSPEKINLTLRFDAAEKSYRMPQGTQVDVSDGILPELSALESLMKEAKTQVSVGGSQNSPTLVRTKEIPLVLFLWGGHRVIPITILSMTITEQKFDGRLNPVRAEVKVTVQVLEEEDAKLNDTAFRSYQFTENEKQMLKNKFLSTQKSAAKGASLPSGCPIDITEQ